MTMLVNIDEMSDDQMDLMLKQILVRKQDFLQKQVEELTERQAKSEASNEITSQQLVILNHRLDNFDLVNVEGDPQQRLNAMIRKYAADSGLSFQGAWRNFRQAYDTAYRANLTSLLNNYKERHGLKSLTMPQYLSLTEKIEDAIRVADKLLNKKTSLRAVN